MVILFERFGTSCSKFGSLASALPISPLFCLLSALHDARAVITCSFILSFYHIVLSLIVQDGTRRACTPNEAGEFGFVLPDGRRVVYCTSKQKMVDQIAQTTLHTFAHSHVWELPKQTRVSADVSDAPSSSSGSASVDLGPYDTEFLVVDGDCLEATESLIARGMRPVVLNMASDYTPGGGYRGGSGAQEENLFRRTNLLRVLSNEDKWYDPRGKGEVPPNKLYPLPDPSTLYSPSVFVLRSTEEKGYPWLENPYEVAFIASAAYRRPRLENDNIHLLPKFAEGFMRKVRAVLWTAAMYGHDSCVLSAWGCGAFRNPPLHIAQLFKEVLLEDWIKGRFKNVTFAIFDDHNSRKEHNPEGNVLPFQQVFGTTTTKTQLKTPSSSSSASSSSSSTTTQGSSIPGGDRVRRKDKKRKDNNMQGNTSTPPSSSQTSSQDTSNTPT